LSEICGHDFGNLNVDSIENFGEFANKSPLAPLYQEGKNLLDKGGGPLAVERMAKILE
jgi:hypothetical protein